MGQYYLTVNIDKRQFLDPHKFGAGLKLMEFSGQADSIMQGLAVLLAHSNGRGGGDLRIDEHATHNKFNKLLTPEDIALVGSWAGDRIVVAGDYDDHWLFVPEDLKGKEYTWEEYKWDVPAPGGGKFRNKKPTIHHEVFGKQRNKETGNVEDHGETLYSAARAFFEDISDRIMRVVAIGEGGYHPWACVDLTDDGWRDYPMHGNLPTKEPKKPLAGKRLYNEYVKNAKPIEERTVETLAYLIQRDPTLYRKIAALLKEKIQNPVPGERSVRVG